MLDKVLDAFKGMYELVGQTHWITGNYEAHCPMLDEKGDQVVIQGRPVFKIGYCLAGLINKFVYGVNASSCKISSLELIGVRPWHDMDNLDDMLAIEVGKRIWASIKDHSTWPKTVAASVAYEVDSGMRAVEEMTVGEIVKKGASIELWNDSVATRGDVLDVLERCIRQVEWDIKNAPVSPEPVAAG